MKNKVLNRTVVGLGLVSFFADISSEMLYPITPIFLSTVLGASMASVGFIEGFAEALASLLKIYSGVWSDRFEKRKPFILAGYFLAAIAKPLTGLAMNWRHVLLARGLDRTGKGLRTSPRDALLADAVEPEFRGAAFGWHRGMDTFGAAIGPLLAILYLTYKQNSLREIYYWALIPGLAAVLFIFLVPEKKKSLERKARFTWDWKNLSPEFKKYLWSWGIFSCVNSSDIFLLLKTQKSGVSLKATILLYCFYNLLYSLASPYLGGLSDRVGRKKILIFGLLVFAFVYLGFSQAKSLWHFWALFGVYGFYMAATDGVGKALAVDLVDPSMKATGLGILGTVTGLATIFASTAAGLMWDRWGPFFTFSYGAFGAIAAAFLLLPLKEKEIWIP